MNRRVGIIVLMGCGLLTGCGIVAPPLSNRIPSGVTLATIQQIQSDPTLSDAERQQQVRALLGVDDSQASTALVNFMLSLQIPARTPVGQNSGS